MVFIFRIRSIWLVDSALINKIHKLTSQLIRSLCHVLCMTWPMRAKWKLIQIQLTICHFVWFFSLALFLSFIRRRCRLSAVLCRLALLYGYFCSRLDITLEFFHTNCDECDRKMDIYGNHFVAKYFFFIIFTFVCSNSHSFQVLWTITNVTSNDNYYRMHYKYTCWRNCYRSRAILKNRKFPSAFDSWNSQCICIGCTYQQLNTLSFSFWFCFCVNFRFCDKLINFSKSKITVPIFSRSENLRIKWSDWIVRFQVVVDGLSLWLFQISFSSNEKPMLS